MNSTIELYKDKQYFIDSFTGFILPYPIEPTTSKYIEINFSLIARTPRASRKTTKIYKSKNDKLLRLLRPYTSISIAKHHLPNMTIK